MALAQILFDYTFLTVLTGSVLIGCVSGIVGCFAVLRRQSLVGDVVAHSSLFGVMVAFLLSYLITGQGNKSLAWLLPGACLAGMAALGLSNILIKYGRVREDSSLGVMLAVFFGTGIAILRWVDRAQPPIPGKRGLDEYLFGMAASMSRYDLIVIAVFGAFAIGTIALFWKELKLLTFDPLYAQCLGFRIQVLETILLTLIICGIVIGIQSIGVILMVAMLVTPAATAIQWTARLSTMVVLAGLIGCINGVIGCMVSVSVKGLPTGPVVVLAGIATLLVSICFGTRHGLVWRQSISEPPQPGAAEIGDVE